MDRKKSLDMVGRSQNGGTDDTKEGDVHEGVGSVRYATVQDRGWQNVDRQTRDG